ncbi:hypothetical protein [Trinickia sp.]|uniref:hypothetical protein n=1 Tax=Trinickia sp. TaxID=2571163 RepID=UPI003F81798C
MNLGFRCLRAALLAALPAFVAPVGAQAQQFMGERAPNNAADQRLAPEDRDAAARAAADRLGGIGGDPEALLGAPAALDDPYRSAYDAAGREGSALRNTQRVPRGALANEGYGPKPAARGNGKAKAPPDLAANDDPGEAKANKADPGAQTPMGSALSIYHGPGDVGKAAGQVYKMPW